MNIILFDIDGTLTPSGEKITLDMRECLVELKNSNLVMGLVGGGTIEKIRYQMDNAFHLFKYIFAECGSVVYIDGKLIKENIMTDNVCKQYLNEIIRFSLKYISEMPILFSGGQIDFRKGLIYISPPGMQAGPTEREFFKKKDKLHDIRNKFIIELKKCDCDNIFDFVLGGEVGITMYLKGCDKSQVLQYFDLKNDTIYFFGDRVGPNGNDYPLYSNTYVHGVSVTNYKDTIVKIKKLISDIC